MKTIFLIPVLFAAFASIASAQDAKPTADRHMARGVPCAMCHAGNDTANPVRKAQCLACHGGSYEAMAKRTEGVKPNPHFNHFGDKDCSSCHKGHGPSVLTCDECHKFNLKTP